MAGAPPDLRQFAAAAPTVADPACAPGEGPGLLTFVVPLAPARTDREAFVHRLRLCPPRRPPPAVAQAVPHAPRARWRASLPPQSPGQAPRHLEAPNSRGDARQRRRVPAWAQRPRPLEGAWDTARAAGDSVPRPRAVSPMRDTRRRALRVSAAPERRCRA